MSSEFSTKAYAKWILAGEHAVLKGYPAIVFPLNQMQLQLHYQATLNPLHIDYTGENRATASQYIQSLIQLAFKQLHLDEKQIYGTLRLKNPIPTGAGLGSSAALSVVIAKWIQACYAPQIDVYTTAHQLEHHFHGVSSGVDVAGSMHDGPIYFIQGKYIPIKLTWKPHFQLYNSNLNATTKDCIHLVSNYRTTHPTEAKHTDEQMAEAVELAKIALESNHSNIQKNVVQLAKAMKQASSCFQKWGLITPKLSADIQKLYDKGAHAVKPTGSGFGGHLLSLWPT